MTTAYTESLGQIRDEEGYAPCLCGLIRIDIPQEPGKPFDASLLPRQHRQYLDTVIGDEAGWVYLETLCDARTKRVFAPGHDARVKGLLQTAVMFDTDVTINSMSTSPLNFAQNFGFEDQVAAAIGRKPREPKAAKEPKAPKAPKAKKAPKGKAVAAKVGRWTYEGVLDGDEFVYTNKKGQTLRTFFYTLVEAGA